MKNKTHWTECAEIGILAQYWWVCKMMPSLWEKFGSSSNSLMKNCHMTDSEVPHIGKYHPHSPESEAFIQTKTCIQIVVHSSPFHPNQKVGASGVSNSWRMGKKKKKKRLVHTMPSHAAIKRNGALIRATPRMNVKTIMPSERGQMQKTTYCMTTLVSNMGNIK